MALLGKSCCRVCISFSEVDLTIKILTFQAALKQFRVIFASYMFLEQLGEEKRICIKTVQ